MSPELLQEYWAKRKFCTASKDYRDIKAFKVLLASSNAPVYYDTPVVIGNDNVDGGVGRNCSLAQAIQRAKKLFGKNRKYVNIVSVLLIENEHYYVT